MIAYDYSNRQIVVTMSPWSPASLVALMLDSGTEPHVCERGEPDVAMAV